MCFPGLITQSSNEGIWQEHSSVFTGVWSQVLLVSFFSVISIRTNCHLEFLCVEAYCGFCCQVQIRYFLPEKHLLSPDTWFAICMFFGEQGSNSCPTWASHGLFLTHNHVSLFPGSCLCCRSLETTINARQAEMAIDSREVVLLLLPWGQFWNTLKNSFTLFPAYAAIFSIPKGHMFLQSHELEASTLATGVEDFSLVSMNLGREALSLGSLSTPIFW